MQEICSLLKRMGRRFTVADYTNPSGSAAYRVSGRTPNGKQVRRNFGTYAEAVLHCAALEMQAIQVAGAAALQMGLTGATFPTNVVSLASAEKPTDQPRVEPCTLGEAIDRFTGDVEFKSFRQRTQADYRGRLNRFKKAFGGVQLSALSSLRIPMKSDTDSRAPDIA